MSGLFITPMSPVVYGIEYIQLVINTCGLVVNGQTINTNELCSVWFCYISQLAINTCGLVVSGLVITPMSPVVRGIEFIQLVTNTCGLVVNG